VLVVGFMPKAQAEARHIYGYAWSGNTGWIGFTSCTNPDIESTCGAYPYGVTYDPGTGVLSGFAWSENVGWIKFGGLSSWPTGHNTTAENAKLILTGDEATEVGKITGWARACSGTVSGDCSSMTSRTDGWDGWISLDGTNYGVRFNRGGSPYTSSFAWGSDVVGWVDFSGVTLDPFNDTAISTFLNGPTCVTNTNPSATLDWITEGVNDCNINGTSVPINGTGSFNVPSSPFVFTLTCSEISNPSNHRTNTISVKKQLSCTPTSIKKKPKFIER